MEEAILEAEAALEAAERRLADPDVVSDADAAHEAYQTHEQARKRVAELYDRLFELYRASYRGLKEVFAELAEIPLEEEG